MKNLLKAKNLWRTAVLAVAAISFVATREAAPVKAAGTGSVVAVPWMGSELLYHEVTSGGQVFLQAVGTDVNGNALTGISSATWDAGDGNGPQAASMPLGNGLAIERTVSYSGAAGQPFTATVKVTMTNGDVYTDTMNIRIAANTRETRVNMAIDKALWYLHKRQVRTTADGKTAGYWSNTCCSTINNQLAGTAPAVQAFEINNHRESGDRLKDPYVDTVKLGLRFILSSTTGNGTNGILRSRAKVLQGTNNPDGNGNNRVLNSSENDHSIYLGGQVIDALVASGTPAKLADVGEATWVNGQAYSTIVQDIIDGYSQGQNDDRGGWLYTPNDGTVGGNGSFDISSSHWWGAGVLAAQGWNIDAPAFIKNQLKNIGIPAAHSATGGFEAHAPAAGECHWYYRDNNDASWDNYKNLTPAGLILMNAAGIPKTDAVWKCTEKWIANRFASTKGNPYSMYQTTKGMRTAFDATGTSSPVTLLNGTIDWYADYADYIVSAQNASTGQINYNDGGTAASQIQGDMQTAWNVIILSPSLFELPPSASCSASPSTIGKFGGTVNFSAAASFHPDPTATITSYAWNFGDASPAGAGVTTSHNYAIPASFPTTRNATVTVTDSNGNSATASCPVTIVNNNVPPSVTIAGPYTVCQGSPLTLTATATDEDGTVNATAWDLETPINFAPVDATGLTVNATAFFAAKPVGAYNIGFRATDDNNASSSAFSTVTVIAANDPSCNQPPVANDDGASTLSGTPATINVLANDTDADLNTLTVTSTTAPSNGTITVNGDGSITYTPNLGFAGTDTFTYTIGDGHGGSDTATVSVTVTKRQATLAAGSGTKVYGSADPVLTPTSSGFLPDITVTQTARDAGDSVGSYATHAEATGATLANYDVAYSDGVFTITQLAATVTAGGGTKVFGAGDPVIGATSSGFLAADNIAVSYTGRDAGENVGSYATHATASGAALANYAVTNTDGVFTITQADSTAAATGGAFTYDGAAHAGSCAFAGVNGEVLNGTLTYSSGAAPVAAGSYTVTCDFAGNANYNASSATATITIAKADATCAVTGYTVTYDTAAHTATGSCTGVNGEALAGLDLSASTHTNAASYSDAWAFTDVTGNYNNTSGTVADVILKAPTKTTLAISTGLAAAGAPVTLTATVISIPPGAGTPNGTVTFTEGATVIGTATLNASGVATLTTTTLSNGPHTITATYNESQNYLSSTSNTVTTLIYGYPVGGGTFVIADKVATMGATVNFWGSQWEKNNIPSGGASNASFKGFAVSPTPPTVGATFTAAPGNSAPSPAAVPQYLGIIVTSKVTKSGSNITGTIVKLVVVKVAPGYAGNPGNAGNGTIVAVIQ